MNYSITVRPALDTRDCHSGQPKQQRRTLLQGPFLSITLLEYSDDQTGTGSLNTGAPAFRARLSGKPEPSLGGVAAEGAHAVGPMLTLDTLGRHRQPERVGEPDYRVDDVLIDGNVIIDGSDRSAVRRSWIREPAILSVYGKSP